MTNMITPQRAPRENARLVNLLNPREIVEFDYNPVEIGLAHDAEPGAMYVNRDKAIASSGASLSALMSIGSTRLHFSQLLFTGIGCRQVVELLKSWVVPNLQVKQAPSAVGADGKPESKRPPLRFEWGAQTIGFYEEVELVRFDCSFTRFSAQAAPIRAEIRNLTLHLVKHSLDEFAASSATSALSGDPAGVPSSGTPGSHQMGDTLRPNTPAPRPGGSGLMGGAPAPPRRRTGGA
ncbi:hypothetical protein [Streptomyces sp. NPDC093223]|uniref:hypothetical protein n=1 Tax=Streptomyces sp. NPDC093223 TaxID=3366033 RepID=UPI0037FC2363